MAEPTCEAARQSGRGEEEGSRCQNVTREWYGMKQRRERGAERMPPPGRPPGRPGRSAPSTTSRPDVGVMIHFLINQTLQWPINYHDGVVVFFFYFYLFSIIFLQKLKLANRTGNLNGI